MKKSAGNQLIIGTFYLTPKTQGQNSGTPNFICHIDGHDLLRNKIQQKFLPLSFSQETGITTLSTTMLETIKALQNGDHLAFGQLFDSSYEALCRYAYSILKDMNEAEDVVQKTFCKLWDQRETLNIQSSISSYLYRIVHNDCINTIQQTTRHQEHNLNYISAMNSTSNSTLEHIEGSDLQRAIDNALAGLPPQCRRVFEMSRIEQLSYSEIAVQLNISTNTVENHIAKALKLLRIELKDFLSIYLIIELLK